MSKVDQSLEHLLSKASPRPVPNEVDIVAAREAVKADWQVISGKRRTRRKLIQYATAATVLISVFALFNVLRAPNEDFIRVASIQRSFGSVYVLSEQSKLTRADTLSTVYAGQTIITGSDAGMACPGCGAAQSDWTKTPKWNSVTTIRFVCKPDESISIPYHSNS